MISTTAKPSLPRVVQDDVLAAVRLGIREAILFKVTAMEWRVPSRLISSRTIVPSALGNYDHVRLRNALQARCEVRGVTDDSLLLRSAGADRVANDHQTRTDVIIGRELARSVRIRRVFGPLVS
jgi:hypothetical protein